MKFLILAVLIVALATQAAGASDDWLMARYDHIECRVDFTIAVIEDTVDAVPEADYLEDHIDTLETDLDELETYAEDANRIGFNAYLLRPHLGNQAKATLDIVGARLKFHKWNVSRETIEDLEDKFQANKDELEDCNFDALVAMAEAKLAEYETVLDRHEDMLGSIEDKGADTSELQDLIDGARDEILDPLEDAINDATTPQEAREAIGAYCLGNGCFNGVNYHFWAWFALLKGESFFDVMVAHVEDNNLEIEDWDELVGDAQDIIDEVQDILEDAGDSVYTATQSGQLWDGLNDGREALKDMFLAIKEA